MEFKPKIKYLSVMMLLVNRLKMRKIMRKLLLSSSLIFIFIAHASADCPLVDEVAKALNGALMKNTTQLSEDVRHSLENRLTGDPHVSAFVGGGQYFQKLKLSTVSKPGVCAYTENDQIVLQITLPPVKGPKK